MQKIVFGVFFVIAGCNTADRESNVEQKSSEQDTIAMVTKLPADTVKVQSGEDGTTADLYEYRNDTLLQSVEVNYISKQEISFKIVSFNKAKNKTSSLTGTAKGNKDCVRCKG